MICFTVEVGRRTWMSAKKIDKVWYWLEDAEKGELISVQSKRWGKGQYVLIIFDKCKRESVVIQDKEAVEMY